MITYYTKEGKAICMHSSDVPFKKLHRENGPAYIKVDKYDEIGVSYWYINGKNHRENGPAIIWSDGDEEWYKFGKRHRLDGPAIEWKNLPKEYWINGKMLNIKEVESWINNNNINLKTKQHQALFMLRFG